MRLTALLLLAAAALAPSGTSRPVFQSLAHGESAQLRTWAFVAGDFSSARVVSAALSADDRAKVESVDYGRYSTVAAFWTFRTSGHVVDVRQILARRGEVTVRVALVPPKPGRQVRDELTAAYHVVIVSKSLLRLRPGLARIEALFETIGRHSVERHLEPPGSRQARTFGFLADRLEATQRFALALRAEDRAKLFEVDYRRSLVLAVFSTFGECGHSVEIRELRRIRRTLIVNAVRSGLPPGVGACFAVTTQYHVVKIPRAVLGSPRPLRVVVEERTEEVRR